MESDGSKRDLSIEERMELREELIGHRVKRALEFQTPVGPAYRRGRTGEDATQKNFGYRPVQRRLLSLRERRAMPYGWITDNARMVHGHVRYGGPDQFAREIATRHRRDFWSESDVQVEAWLEKDTLAGVLYPAVVEEFGLNLFVTRGFSSVTYLQEAAEALRADGRPAFVYVLTDFDPSGLSKAPTVGRELVRRANPVRVEVERLAVTREQIELHGLPTRPTKMTDARARLFMEEHGTGSVELDAVRPKVLEMA